ncbi:MAG: hypothetical protein VCA36_12670, partial [Opitutales bacterium]
MSVETESPPPTTPAEGKRYRLVVKSAEEAVRVIREKLGASARVLSVRQMDGQGLTKFISSPKLEVVVEVPPPGSSGEEPLDLPRSSSSESDPQPVPEKEMEQSGTTAEVEDAAGLLADSDNITTLLERAGFDRDFLATVQGWPRWQRVREMSIPEALNEISLVLRDRFREIEARPTTGKVAFFGPPGVG